MELQIEDPKSYIIHFNMEKQKKTTFLLPLERLQELAPNMKAPTLERNGQLLEKDSPHSEKLFCHHYKHSIFKRKNIEEVKS